MKLVWIAVASAAVVVAVLAVLFRYEVTPLVAGELPAAFVLDRIEIAFAGGKQANVARDAI